MDTSRQDIVTSARSPRPWRPWLFFLVLLGLALVWARPLPPGPSCLDHLPVDGPAYRSAPIPLTPAEENFFRGARVAKRLYRIPGGGAFVLIAIDGGENRSSMHDPLFCFLGGGWEAIGSSSLPLGRGEGKRLVLRRDGREIQAAYWFTNGRVQHASPVRLWFQSAGYRLCRGRCGAAPVLVLLQPLDGGTLPIDGILRWTPSLLDF